MWVADCESKPTSEISTMVNRTNPLGLALLVTAVLYPHSIFAQVSPPEPGTYAVSFGFPSSGSGQLGIRKILGSGANAGLDLGFSFDRAEHERPDSENETRTRWSVGLFPNVRFYRGGRANVLPFLALNAGVAYEDRSEDSWNVVVSGGGGVGVEWFPVSSMSLSGTTGIVLYYDRTEPDSPETGSKRVGFSSRTSSLSVNLYF